MSTNPTDTTTEAPVYEPGSLSHQLRAIVGVFLDPFGSFTTLPANQLYPFALLCPVMVFLGKQVTHPGWNKAMGTAATTILILVVGAIFQFLIACLIWWVAKRFGKYFTFRQVFNIHGYSQAPGIIGLIATLGASRLPTPLNPDNPSLPHAIFLLISFCMVVYSLMLLLYGLRVATPPETTEA